MMEERWKSDGRAIKAVEERWKCMEERWKCMEERWKCMEVRWKRIESVWKSDCSDMGVKSEKNVREYSRMFLKEIREILEFPECSRCSRMEERLGTRLVARIDA